MQPIDNKNQNEPKTNILQDNRYNNAISAFTYGFNCLVLDSRTNKLYDCILSIHQEYINILHLIIAKKVSYLLKLHQIYNITDNQFSTETKLKQQGIYHYLILYTQSLDSFTFAFKTEFEKQTFKIGIVLFVKEAKTYYERLNEFDPFKAEAMMTFLEADKDGGNLLDIDEIQNILSAMKINKSTSDILKDIEQINKILYQQQKLKRPTDMKNTELNQFGFQYLLRFYSRKQDLAKIFKEYCNQYKLQTRSNKVSLVDIVRYNENPIMSASQLKEFYLKMLFQDISQEESKAIIESFPVYDAEGKEKPEKEQLINFNSFCSLLSSRRNSAFLEEKKEIYQKMTHPITDYYIASDFTNYSLKGDSNDTKINQFQLSLKRGVRCLHFHLGENNNHQPVLSNSSDSKENLEQLLRIIALKGFEFNPFPIFIKIEHNGLSKQALDNTANIINEIFEDQLYTLPPNYQEQQILPSPQQLKKKVLIMANVNPKLFKAKQKQFPADQSLAFFKILSFFGSRLDFQRKGQFAWNFCNIEDDKIRKLQEVEDENLSNYTKIIMVKSGPTPFKGEEINRNCSVYMRLGVQLGGLTFHNINEENYYLQSLFLQNGGAKCGYLLKPIWMCHKNPKNLYAKNFDSPLFQLSLKVLSGQNCIINDNSKGERVYLEAFLRGNKKQQETSKKYSSSSISEAYYISFELQCTFTIYCTDLATLVLLVRGEDSQKILSGRAIPIKHLREGLHPVYLMGDHFKQSVSSYLLIHCEHKSIQKKTILDLQSKP